MELLLSTEGLSLWDPELDPQLAAEYLDFDYLSNDWVNTDEGRKLIDNKFKTNVLDDDDQHLLLDGSELCDWMETKWDFEDGAFQLNSLEDINLLIQEDEDEDVDVDVDVDVKIQKTESSSSSSTPLLNTSVEAGESQDVVASEVEPKEFVRETKPKSKRHERPEKETQDVASEIVEEEVVRETRPKPYERPCKKEFRKSRKRSQNRTAATRYRMKKREEAEVLSTEEKRLQETNGELTKKVDALSSEIKYLKSLLKEFVQAKRK